MLGQLAVHLVDDLSVALHIIVGALVAVSNLVERHLQLGRFPLELGDSPLTLLVLSVRHDSLPQLDHLHFHFHYARLVLFDVLGFVGDLLLNGHRVGPQPHQFGADFGHFLLVIEPIALQIALVPFELLDFGSEAVVLFQRSIVVVDDFVALRDYLVFDHAVIRQIVEQTLQHVQCLFGG